jgi:hypothetical protein
MEAVLSDELALSGVVGVTLNEYDDNLMKRQGIASLKATITWKQKSHLKSSR